eukprot:scaffold24059_cov101-Isochrysis_galbana.AAC.1
MYSPAPGRLSPLGPSAPEPPGLVACGSRTSVAPLFPPSLYRSPRRATYHIRFARLWWVAAEDLREDKKSSQYLPSWDFRLLLGGESSFSGGEGAVDDVFKVGVYVSRREKGGGATGSGVFPYISAPNDIDMDTGGNPVVAETPARDPAQGNMV